MQRNIWIAAADGDLARMQELVEQHGTSPNAPDHFTYTPMHAAASYAQLDVLAYLVQKGGDVNITDDDGDTPLYTVEDIDTARWLIDHGATIDHRNVDGVSPIDHLDQEYPEVADYLRSRSDPSAPQSTARHAQDAASETLTSNLIHSLSDIIERADAPDDALRAAVSRAVLQGVRTGRDLSSQHDQESPEQDTKRPRMNGS